MEFYYEIERKISQKDVGLVILNAGRFIEGGIEEKQGSDITPVLDTNIYHVAALMKILLPTLHNRDKRLMEAGKDKVKSGLIVTSSISAMLGIGEGNIYSASKIFCNFLSFAVRRELESINSRVELTVLSPGPTITKMSEKYHNHSFWGLWMATSENCVYKALKDMGRERETNGAMSAEILISLLYTPLMHWCTLGEKSQ